MKLIKVFDFRVSGIGNDANFTIPRRDLQSAGIPPSYDTTPMFFGQELFSIQKLFGLIHRARTTSFAAPETTLTA
jgi:hypothetical protein